MSQTLSYTPLQISVYTQGVVIPTHKYHYLYLCPSPVIASLACSTDI